MKNFNLTIVVSGISFIFATCGQHISQAMVPAVVINSFRLEYPKAIDAEWKKRDSSYVVEFEAGLTKSGHKMILDSFGNITYQMEAISERDLPNRVKSIIGRRFPGYTLKQPEKIRKDTTLTYKVELKSKIKSKSKEWMVIFGEGGKIIEKIEE